MKGSRPKCAVLAGKHIGCGRRSRRGSYSCIGDSSNLGMKFWLAVGRKFTADPHVLELDHDKYRGPIARMTARLLRSTATRMKRHDMGRLQCVIETLTQPSREWKRRQGQEDFDFPASHTLLGLTPRPPDIVHFHNMHGGYFDLRALPVISRRIVVVVTLHDSWLLSGHCAHSFDCERWRSGCGSCPDLSIPPAIRRATQLPRTGAGSTTSVLRAGYSSSRRASG